MTNKSDVLLREFGERLTYYLELKGMTQAELSRKSSVSTGLISKYVTSNSNPTVPNLVLIANALNVSVDDLLGTSLNVTKTEEALRILMHNMNEAGQARVLDYARLLYKSGDFKKQKSEDLGIQNARTA